MKLYSVEYEIKATINYTAEVFAETEEDAREEVLKNSKYVPNDDIKDWITNKAEIIDVVLEEDDNE